MQKRKIDFILAHLSAADKDLFLRELIVASSANKDTKEIIQSWLETAEINAQPHLRAKILSRYAELRNYLLTEKHA